MSDELSIEALEALLAEKKAKKAAEEQAAYRARKREYLQKIETLLADPLAKVIRQDIYSLLAKHLPAPPPPTGSKKVHTAKDHPSLMPGATYLSRSGEYKLLVLGDGKLKVGRADGQPFHADLEGTKWSQECIFSAVSAAAEACGADKRLRDTWVLDDNGAWLDTAGAGEVGKDPSINGWAFWAIK